MIIKIVLIIFMVFIIVWAVEFEVWRTKYLRYLDEERRAIMEETHND